MSQYRELMLEGAPGHDPEEVEETIRGWRPTLNHLTRDELLAEARTAAEVIDMLRAGDV